MLVLCGQEKGPKLLIYLGPLFNCGPLWTFKWWSRGELNPQNPAQSNQRLGVVDVREWTTQVDHRYIVAQLGSRLGN